MNWLAQARTAIRPLFQSLRSVSFSQYGEDLLLAVSLFPGREGTYVDVGAYHPWRTSNTYKLYLRGWQGMTIEPNPDVVALFRKLRPRDTHVCEGVSAAAGQFSYFRFADGKLNTFCAEQAKIYEALGKPVLEVQKLQCRPLQAILDQYGFDRFDLLSLDCEGGDLSALETLDFSRTRPSAVIVEDYAAFHKLLDGYGESAIEIFLRLHDYLPCGQAMYSTLYVDLHALHRRENSAFRFAEVQFAYDPHEAAEQRAQQVEISARTRGPGARRARRVSACRSPQPPASGMAH